MSGTLTTVGDIVTDIIRELSQVPGQATQVYSTPRMQQHVQDAVLLELEEMWWPMLMYYQRVAIDAVTGLPVDDLRGPIGFIDEWRNIAAVFPANSNRKMPELPQSINPYTLSSTSTPLFISPDMSVPHRPFRVWPAVTGDVVVYAMQGPTLPMALTDQVYLDRLLLMYDACWMYAVDDGTVPAQVNKFQVLATNRRKQIKSSFSTQPLLLDPHTPPTDQAIGADLTYFVLDTDPLA